MGTWEELAAAHLDEQSEQTFAALVEAEWPYTQKLAALMARQMCPSLADEATSAGGEGLLAAARTYNGAAPWRGWLRMRVKAAIVDLIRRDDVVPRSTRDLITALDRCAEDLRSEWRREPTLDETLARHRGAGTIPRWAPRLLGDLRPISIFGAGDDGPLPVLVDPPLADEDAIAMSALRHWIADLDDRSAEVMRRSLDGEPKMAIAGDLGLTPSRVSQLWHEIARTLRRRAVAEGLLVA